VSADTVGDLLREEGFSLQAGAKTLEGRQHPDRDAQFQVTSGGLPVSRYWSTRTTSWTGRDRARRSPTGSMTSPRTLAGRTVGTDHDTAAFAVASIRRWWQARGRHDYPAATRLLITVDAGGSNGYRTRAWKTELAALAAKTGLDITVCHMPPGVLRNSVDRRSREPL
jgi:hypothetical protein